MRLRKFGHSCVRVDDGDRSLVFDPGAFSDAGAALDGARAVLITHEHYDHVDEDAIRTALRAQSGVRMFAPQAVADTFAEEFGDQVCAVGPGESFDAAGFAVTTHAGVHALLHPSMPTIANVGFLVDGAVYHPGDSLLVPPVEVATLLLPAMAPWARTSEIVDFAAAVGAPQALPIHDALVNDNYFGLLGMMMDNIAGPFGVSLASFDEPVTVAA